MSVAELKIALTNIAAALPGTATAAQGHKADSAMQPVPGMGLSENDFNDAAAIALLNAQPAVTGKGLSTNDYSNAEKAKVAGAQPAVTGKGLSTNDYTTADKALVTGAQQQVSGKGLSTLDYTAVEAAKVQASTDRIKVYANTAVATYTSTTLVAVAGLSFTAVAGASYEVEILAKHSSTLATGGMALGLSALPTGAKQKLDAAVIAGNSATLGTNYWFKTLLASGDSIAATGSTASLPNLARITGLIEIGTTGGTIQVMAGAAGIAPNIGLAIGDATMRVTRVAG